MSKGRAALTPVIVSTHYVSEIALAQKPSRIPLLVGSFRHGQVVVAVNLIQRPQIPTPSYLYAGEGVTKADA